MSYETENRATTASGAAGMPDDPRRYRIVSVGSASRRAPVQCCRSTWDETLAVGERLDHMAFAGHYGLIQRF
jgi:hypothetical protein